MTTRPRRRPPPGCSTCSGTTPLDADPLAESWRFQRDARPYVVPYAKDPQGLGISPADPGAPASGAALRTALAAARRG
ncbi:hypothetical protein ACIOEX_24665 [Streptomyces sp. NPDC087850]|uniref:hypothetical protein n=1 Tax=Streptomyces sp. NPDC087850 TaxID=3365809 RepID=UPI0037FE092A